jgi:hypothetical protein
MGVGCVIFEDDTNFTVVVCSETDKRYFSRTLFTECIQSTLCFIAFILIIMERRRVKIIVKYRKNKAMP